MNPRFRVFILLGIVGLFTLGQAVDAQLKAPPGDYPAWRGSDRTGLSTETGFLSSWPKEGPKLVWKISGLGDGYSTPSIAGGKLFVMGTKGKTEQVIALNLTDGKRLCATDIGTMRGGYPGPRSTPTVDGDLVYSLSSDGKLACLKTADGAVEWTRDLPKDFGGRSGGWAYTESPLIDGERVIITPGGDSATIVCLNKKTGKEIWKSAISITSGNTGKAKGKAKGKGRRGGYNTAGYSSVIVAETNKVKQYVQFIAGGVVGVSAQDGKLLWHYDQPANGTANASTPIFANDSVFAASAYGTGGGRAKIVPEGNGFKAEQAYFIRSYQNHHGGSVLVGDYLYGTNGSALVCINYKTGEIAWQNRGVGKGSVMYADGHIYHRGENGDVALVEANPTAYTEKGRFSQPERSRQRAWPYPVVAGGKLYLRDWDKLFCYDIKK